jgi:stearoyl-CoA desaturase (delta-9 desaturase)
VAPVPTFAAPKLYVDPQTLQAVIACRYNVLATYAMSLKRVYADEISKLHAVAPQDARILHSLKPRLHQHEKMIPENERRKLDEVLPKSRVLLTMVTMRRELAAIWGRSAASRDQLVRQLQDWCQRGEASGIRPLAEFSRQLRQYA